MPNRTLSDIGVKKLKPRKTRYVQPDPELRGHYIRTQPSGVKSFVAVARDPNGKQIWTTIGAADAMRIAEAREKAREVILRVRAGQPAVPVKPDSVEAVAENFVKRYVAEKGLRSKPEIERSLNMYVLPRWRGREFVSIRRSDVASLLDAVADEHGPSQADAVLALVRKISNWYATRCDGYVSPFVMGMRRTSPKERERKRILKDDELRAVWRQAEANGRFGALVRLLLLTAQRRDKVASMRWADVSLDGLWRVPTEKREKGTPGELLLPALALEIIQAQPRVADNLFVFAGRGSGPFSGYSKAKASFDAKLPAMPPWVLHDLRRTARSLMSKAGVRPDIAERVLGHKLQGVEGVYDRHEYGAEKADALKRLAGLIDTILNPPSGKVVPLRGAAR